MPRNTQTQDVEEVEEVTGPETEETKSKGPKRGELPEGYVTPIGLAKVLGERGLQKNRDGEVQSEVRPQMVYSYMKNAPKDDPFPIETVTDSNGIERQALKLDEGVAWWERKNARADQRKQNAAEKAAKKAERAAAKEAEAQSEDEGQAEEAE